MHSTVSVVIPAYNSAGVIERALNSVLAQTYAGIAEVIVVDDGSQDDTAQLVREMYPGVTLIQQENAGREIARNVGVDAASGDYIAFLDHDDEWFPEKTQVQMACFRACPGLRMTIPDMILCEDDEQGPGPPQDDGAAPREPVLEPLTFRRCFPTVPFHYGCSGWVLERSLFWECGGFRQVTHREDREWLWRALFMGYSIAFVRQPLYHYFGADFRRSAEQLTRFTLDWYASLPPIFEDFVDRATRPPARLTMSEADLKRAEFYWNVGWGLWRVGLPGEARASFERSRAFSGTRGLQALGERLAISRPDVYDDLLRLRNRFVYMRECIARRLRR
ncbi:MAG: glycosyltransferase family 2 protein [Armatimonadota bacterium]|jgi:glycosyltransferase involved in cell wall biosynthesis